MANGGKRVSVKLEDVIGSGAALVNGLNRTEVDAVHAAVTAHGSLNAAAKAMGRGRYWVTRRYEARDPQPEVNPDPEFEAAEKRLATSKEEVRKLKLQVSSLVRDTTDMNEFMSRVYTLQDFDAAPPKWVVEDRGSSESFAGTPSVMWSDWHLNEVVDPAQLSGINAFNWEIADQRIEKLVSRTIDLCFNHMTGANYPGVVVNVGGDLISGELHPELQATDELPMFPAIHETISRLIWCLSAMADKFGRVYVPTAFGNHGRIFDKKPRAKDYVYRNADWHIMCMVRKYFENDDRIKFSISPTGDTAYRVYHHRYYLTHGDSMGVRGGDGIIGAIGPIMRGSLKVRRSEAELNRDFDTLIMGHWHQYIPMPSCIVNNTLKGYDEYARRFLRAVPTLPGQSLWFTHPKWGITAQWEVKLEGKMATRAPWTSWEGE